MKHSQKFILSFRTKLFHTTTIHIGIQHGGWSCTIVERSNSGRLVMYFCPTSLAKEVLGLPSTSLVLLSPAQLYNGCVHMKINHVPKDWDSWFELHVGVPSQSRSGSAHCEVIFCSYCAVRADLPMHGFSMAWARISKMHTHESRSERALCSHVLESGFLGGSRSKMQFFSRFKSLIWNSFVFTWAKMRLSNQERAESLYKNKVLKRLSECDSSPCEHSLCCI